MTQVSFSTGEPAVADTVNRTASCSSGCVLPPMVAVSVAPTVVKPSAVTLVGALATTNGPADADDGRWLVSPPKDATIW